ncbi:unnamed protein product [Urochloa humidicola]
MVVWPAAGLVMAGVRRSSRGRSRGGCSQPVEVPQWSRGGQAGFLSVAAAKSLFPGFVTVDGIRGRAPSPFPRCVGGGLPLPSPALSETLQAQINTLNLIILNAVQTCSKKIDESNGLQQQNNTQITSASASDTNAPHQHMNPDAVQLQQLQTEEQPSEHPQVHALEPQQKDDQVVDQQQHQDF